MNCQKYKENISGWLDEELTDEEYHELTRHIKECSSCREEFETARQIQNLIDNTGSTDGYNVPDQIWTEIEKRISKPDRQGIVVHFLRYSAVAAAAAAAFIIIMHIPVQTTDNSILCEALTNEEALAAELTGAVLMGEEHVDLDDMVVESYSRQAMNQIMGLDDF